MRQEVEDGQAADCYHSVEQMKQRRATMEFELITVFYLLTHPGGSEEHGVLAAWRCDLSGRPTQLGEKDTAALIHSEASVVAEVQFPPPRSFQSLQAGRSLKNTKNRHNVKDAFLCCLI
ncbi:hypothetical protein GOODEAATRI_027234 [Goodea atripinnis]|uniref:Uncharacterized protein n=1 Tax=Goodea atripinnis TaxID=208336 RepID=A0ABV0NS00_9TELE